MTDLLRVLPHFPVGQFARLLPTLEKHRLSTCDLLTLEAADIGKRTQLPLLDVKRLCDAVLHALHTDLGVANSVQPQNTRPQQQPSVPGPDLQSDDPTRTGGGGSSEEPTDLQTAGASSLRNTATSLAAQWQTISTLDPVLDRALGGGIPAGYVTEITGESGAGKTQFLLTLLLSVQLPPPRGLGRPALYISTEAPLSTRRLAQLLSANPLFQRLPASEQPSLDNIISTATPDLESQDHILTFQVPVEVERRGIGLLVLDSVAANYRAEFERSAASSASQQHGSNMGARTTELIRLGMHLRDLAQRHNLAVVVANQVADRFSSSSSSSLSLTPRTPASSLHQHHSATITTTTSANSKPRLTQESPLATRSRGPVAPAVPSSSPLPQPRPHPPPSSPPQRPDIDTSPPHDDPAGLLLLDHQQRWFTGWGDAPDPHPARSPFPFQVQFPPKTPSLGLVWATQLAVRIALFRRPAYYRDHDAHAPAAAGRRTGAGVGGVGGGWRRWMKVVFAPHAAESGPGFGDGVAVGGGDEEEEEGGVGGGKGEGTGKEGKGAGGGAVEFEVWMGGLRAVRRGGGR
ncbi:hypothetical protein VTK26DRAFT_6135 [Humicola hyalothermophila]